MFYLRPKNVSFQVNKIIMKCFLITFIILFFSNLNAEEFKYKVVGKLKTDNVIDFPEGGKFVSFHHEGGFEKILVNRESINVEEVFYMIKMKS